MSWLNKKHYSSHSPINHAIDIDSMKPPWALNYRTDALHDVEINRKKIDNFNRLRSMNKKMTMVLHAPAFRRPLKTKSAAVTLDRSLQGNPFTRGAFLEKSATQKSCKGSGSAAWTINIAPSWTKSRHPIDSKLTMIRILWGPRLQTFTLSISDRYTPKTTARSKMLNECVCVCREEVSSS